MRAVLIGPSSHPYRDGLAKAVTTEWSFANVDGASAAAALAEADAAISIAWNRDSPPAPRLRLVHVPGAGTDLVDAAALPPGVRLCNCFEHEPAVAEYALLGMLEFAQRLHRADRDMRRGNWSRSSRFGGAPGGEIFGRTVAIVGLGRIGRAVAARARAFGMRVIAANRTLRAGEKDVDAVFGLDRLADALAQADFVVLGCALTPETRGLIDARALAAMKPGAVVVNVARGPVIDEAALFDALANRRIGGAVIDTWWRYPAAVEEPPAGWAHRFDLLDNVVLSPHVAGWTSGTVARRTAAMAANLDRLARGEALENVVAG
jgi:phosphoglycerate dehydrogenase-like enzyme